LPALVLLDVMMPGLSGQNVLRQLRKSYGPQELPVLMVSAKGDQETINKLFKSGCNDYIRKPFSGAELLNRMKHHLTMASLARASSGTSEVGKSSDHRASEDSKSLIREADMAGALSEVFTGILPESLQQTLFTALCSNAADKSVQTAKDKLRRWLDQERGSSSSRIVSLENELQRKNKEIADLNRQLKFQEESARRDREDSRTPSVKQAAKDKSRYATTPALDSASQRMRQISRQTSDKSQSSEPLQRQVSPKFARQISASQKEDLRHPPLQERCETIQEISDDPIVKTFGQHNKLIYQQHRFLLQKVDVQQKQLTKMKEEFIQHRNELMSGRFSSFSEGSQGATFQLPATEEKLFLHLLDQEQRFSNIVLKVPLPEQHDLLNFWASVQQQLVFLVVERERQQARMREAEMRLKQQLAIILQFQNMASAQFNVCHPAMIS
jgi:DNA-binding response OmpR family regulator